ncbi:MAG: hypothetical protein LBJ73_01585 [Rickettsiales bacterium]|nr:hypothetical protein [Rickettsiales bacterium]
MAKQIKSFYKRFLLGLLLLPILRLIGFDMEANAYTCLYNANQECTPGDTMYVACGTSQLQKKVCESCTYDFCLDLSCLRSETRTGSHWVNSDSCTTYASNCSAGATSSQACSDTIGAGTQTRSCQTITAGSTYYMWGAYGRCNYTSCVNSNDVADSGYCYCKTSCAMPDSANGYGQMVAEVRTSSVCPAASSSSSV